jgi:hypothetical protein
MIFAGHRRPVILVTTLGRQTLTSNDLASPYSQLKWKFSIKTTQLKALKIFEPNSQAKMAPDRRLEGRQSGATDFTTSRQLLTGRWIDLQTTTLETIAGRRPPA